MEQNTAKNGGNTGLLPEQKAFDLVEALESLAAGEGVRLIAICVSVCEGVGARVEVGVDLGEGLVEDLDLLVVGPGGDVGCLGLIKIPCVAKQASLAVRSALIATAAWRSRSPSPDTSLRRYAIACLFTD
jgi:hypothetical protein